jgi:hypothetical protein
MMLEQLGHPQAGVAVLATISNTEALGKAMAVSAFS